MGLVEQARHQCPWGGLLEIYLSGLPHFISLGYFEVKSISTVLFGIMLGAKTNLSRFNFLKLFRMALLEETPVHDVVSRNGKQSY